MHTRAYAVPYGRYEEGGTISPAILARAAVRRHDKATSKVHASDLHASRANVLSRPALTVAQYESLVRSTSTP